MRRAGREIAIGHDRAFARVVPEPDFIGAGAIGVTALILLFSANAWSQFTPDALGEDILQKARDWQDAPNPKPPTEFRAVQVLQGTGRTDWYRFNGSRWGAGAL